MNQSTSFINNLQRSWHIQGELYMTQLYYSVGFINLPALLNKIFVIRLK